MVFERENEGGLEDLEKKILQPLQKEKIHAAYKRVKKNNAERERSKTNPISGKSTGA